MKVICKQKNAKGFDLNEVTTILRNYVEYPLEIGKEYLVMGLRIPKRGNCLYYLVDEFDRPFWMPYLLFDISDNKLPHDWYVEVFDKKGPGDLLYLSGFYELCNDEDFHDSLMDRDEDAMRVYFLRKMEYENSQNSI